MKLTTTNDILQIVLGGAVTTNQLQCLTSYKIYTTTTTTDGKVAINTNNTTDVNLAGAPGASEVYEIQNINVYNRDTVAQTVTIKLDVSGTETILFRGTIGTGEVLSWSGESGWRSSTGLTPSLNNRYLISGALFETMDRNLVNEVNTAVLASGRLSLAAIHLPIGTLLSSISFHSATTALATGTNQLFGLFDINRNLLVSSVNGTSGAWAANSLNTLALASTFTTTYTGLYYLGIMIAATTVPTLKGNTARVGGQLQAQAPSMGGTSNTGLTTALPATANAPGTVTTSFWGCVS